jgi:hypothetical protein
MQRLAPDARLVARETRRLHHHRAANIELPHDGDSGDKSSRRALPHRTALHTTAHVQTGLGSLGRSGHRNGCVQY